jgi:hypothetical protein
VVPAPEELPLRKLPHAVAQVERPGDRPLGIFRHPARRQGLEPRQDPAAGRYRTGSRLEQLVIACEEPGHHPLVVIDDHDVLAAALGNTPVAGGGNPLFGLPHHPHIEFGVRGGIGGEALGGIVGAVVVHHHDLPQLLRQGLRKQRIERHGEFRPPVIGRYDKRQFLLLHEVSSIFHPQIYANNRPAAARLPAA